MGYGPLMLRLQDPPRHCAHQKFAMKFLQENSQAAFLRQRFALKYRNQLTYEELGVRASSGKSLENAVRIFRDGAVRCFGVNDGSLRLLAAPPAQRADPLVVSCLVHSKQTAKRWYYVEGALGSDAFPTYILCTCSAGLCVSRVSGGVTRVLRSHAMALVCA